MKSTTQSLFLYPFGVFLAATLVASTALAQQVEAPVRPVDFSNSSPGSKPTAGADDLTVGAAMDGARIAAPGKRSPVVFTPQQYVPGAEDGAIPTMRAPALDWSMGDRVFYDERDGVQWAISADYMASASSAGFSYMPFLGSDAPKTYEFKMRLASATLGGKSIALQASALVERHGDRVTLDRGPIDVFYDLSSTSVEQSFGLEISAVDAELVLNIAVDSDLPFQKGNDGVRYAGDLGGVDYGHAVVIDGAGHYLELPIEASQNSLRLVVPASFMRTSVAPVIVDPTITTYQVNRVFHSDLANSDVAYDQTTNTFAYTFEQDFSSALATIWVVTYNCTTGVEAARASLNIGIGDTRQPSIASDNASNQFLVSYRRQNNDGRWEIVARLVNALDITQKSSRFLIASTSGAAGSAFGYENGQVDVGGKSQGSSLFKLVWNRHFFNGNYDNIRTATVIPLVPFVVGSTPPLSPVQAITVAPGSQLRGLKISKSSGESDVAEWRVAFLGTNNSTGNQDLFTALYADDNTTVLGATSWLGINPTWNAVDLDVSDGLADLVGPTFNTPVYLVAVHVDGPNAADIWLYGLQGSDTFGQAHLTALEHQNLGMRPRRPVIATSATRFTVAYTEYDIINTGYKCFSSSVDLTDTFRWAVTDRRSLVANVGSSWLGGTPGSSSSYSGGRYDSRHVATSVSVREAGIWTLQAAVVHANQPPTAGFQYCNGAPNSTGDYGFIYMAGNSNTSSSKTLHASAMPLNQFGYFLVGHGGSGTVTPPGSNGTLCLIGGVLGRYNAGGEIKFTGGAGAFNLTINPTAIRSNSGNVVGMSGQTYNFQAWHREDGGSSNFTNALSLKFN